MIVFFARTRCRLHDLHQAEYNLRAILSRRRAGRGGRRNLDPGASGSPAAGVCRGDVRRDGRTRRSPGETFLRRDTLVVML